MMSTKRFLTTSLLLMALSLTAQDDEAEVMAVVKSVFEGMATNNGQLVRDAFTSDAQSFTVLVKVGVMEKRAGSIEKFAEAVNKDKDQQWYEPIWNEKVNIDGPFASVWVDYAFYLDKEFHHCGVDAFHLVKDASGWKIFHLVDTRRKKDCRVPKAVKKQYGG